MRRKKVLIVDDSALLRDALTAAFEDAGYDVGAGQDGEDVLRKMSRLEPDAVLLDVFMPRLNGAEVCRLVKTHPQWRRTWLVLMSSRVTQREVDDYRRLGADEILLKPFAPAVAVAAVGKGVAPPELAGA